MKRWLPFLFALLTITFGALAVPRVLNNKLETETLVVDDDQYIDGGLTINGDAGVRGASDFGGLIAAKSGVTAYYPGFVEDPTYHIAFFKATRGAGVGGYGAFQFNHAATLLTGADELVGFLNNGAPVAFINDYGEFRAAGSSASTGAAFTDTNGGSGHMFGTCTDSGGGCYLTFQSNMKNGSFHGWLTVSNRGGEEIMDGGVVYNEIAHGGMHSTTGSTLIHDVYGNVISWDGWFQDAVEAGEATDMGCNDSLAGAGTGFNPWDFKKGRFGYYVPVDGLVACTHASAVGDGGYEHYLSDLNAMTWAGGSSGLFVDRTTTQSAAGDKTWLGDAGFAGNLSVSGDAGVAGGLRATKYVESPSFYDPTYGATYGLSWLSGASPQAYFGSAVVRTNNPNGFWIGGVNASWDSNGITASSGGFGTNLYQSQAVTTNITSANSGAGQTMIQVGTKVADGTVDSSAHIFSVATGISGTKVEKLYTTTAGTTIQGDAGVTGNVNIDGTVAANGSSFSYTNSSGAFYVRTIGDAMWSCRTGAAECDMNYLTTGTLLFNYIRASSTTVPLQIGYGRNTSGIAGNDTYTSGTSTFAQVVPAFTPNASSAKFVDLAVMPKIEGYGVSTTGTALGVAAKVGQIDGGYVKLADFGTTETDYNTDFAPKFTFYSDNLSSGTTSTNPTLMIQGGSASVITRPLDTTSFPMLSYTGRGTTAFSGTLTGLTSGATAQILVDDLGGGSSGAGHLFVIRVKGTFSGGETISDGTVTATYGATFGQLGRVEISSDSTDPAGTRDVGQNVVVGSTGTAANDQVLFSVRDNIGGGSEATKFTVYGDGGVYVAGGVYYGGLGHSIAMSNFGGMHNGNATGVNVLVAAQRFDTKITGVRLTGAIGSAGTGAAANFTFDVYDNTSSTVLCTSASVPCTGTGAYGVACSATSNAAFDDIYIRIDDSACSTGPNISINYGYR